MEKWKDPRTPVSVTQVGRYKVTIYDQALYNESLRLYRDEPRDQEQDDNRSPQFVKKQKKEARYNWISKPEQPLRGRIG